MKLLAGLLLGLVVGYAFGWGRAHVIVAKECERLGGFFVGEQVFKCSAVERREGEG